jgi:hypothetical protein
MFSSLKVKTIGLGKKYRYIKGIFEVESLNVVKFLSKED